MKPIDWDIRREGHRWSDEEFDQRIVKAPEKIEYVDGIFGSDRQRLSVLGMLLENLGIDRAVQFGKGGDGIRPPPRIRRAVVDNFTLNPQPHANLTSGAK